MKKKYFLLFWFYIISIIPATGQEHDTLKISSKKHYVFNNISSLIDPNGSALQFGVNYQCKAWLDFQLELGWASDNFIDARLPFEEFVGYRIRPQVRFVNKNRNNNIVIPYSGILLSYQDLTFIGNKNFNIEDSFVQNITYRGRDQTYAWYLLGGIDINWTDWLIANLSIGLGQVWVNTKVDQGVIPENATILDDCIWFCGRSQAIDRKINRLGVLMELRIGYRF